MKIVTWNCNGAFRKKFEHLTKFDADLLIIQECEDPSKAIDKSYTEWATNYVWIGDTKNKGIGIFAKPHIILKKLDWSNAYKDHTVKHFLPCSVNDEFNLLAVWTHQNNSPNFGYMGQFWKYLQVNKEKFQNTIIAGDFNSNVIWDQWDRWWNHSDVVRELKEIGIESLYHRFTKDEPGKEIQPTFYLRRSLERPYHIDYVFASEKLASKLENLSVGLYENWKHISDHSPMCATFGY